MKCAETELTSDSGTRKLEWGQVYFALEPASLMDNIYVQYLLFNNNNVVLKNFGDYVSLMPLLEGVEEV